jgi:CRISPR-associated protein Csy2
MNDISHYLVIRKIEIEAANATSSPLTYGFPAITGFLGAIHALNRKLDDAGFQVELPGVLIACHDIQVQRYRPHAFADYSFNQTRNPVKKDGTTASIIEEGKVNLTVSLIVEVSTTLRSAMELSDDSDEFKQLCKSLLLQQRMAGGSIRSIQSVELKGQSEASDLWKRLLPASVLMDASNDLIDITQSLQNDNPNATALDGLIEVATLHHEPVDTSINKTGWQTRSVKTGKGWLVPMPVGYQAITPQFPPGELAHCRNPEYPSQYVETIYGLGKWVFPNRLPEEISRCFWRYQQENNLFLVNQN